VSNTYLLLHLFLLGIVFGMGTRLFLGPRRLRYFVVVAEELNFTRAAKRLHMSQPPLSKQIHQLEAELDTRLFERLGRCVQLTEAGRLLLREAYRILDQIERTQNLVRRAGRGEVGRIVLGFTPSAANVVLPAVLGEFTGRYPDVELSLHELKADELVEYLSDKWLDVACLYLPFDDDRFRCEVVSSERLVLTLPDGHPLASQATVGMTELAEEPFIMPTRHRHMPGLYGQITALCRQAGFVPREVQREVWQVQTMLGLVGGGVGVALVPETYRDLPRKGVAYKNLRDLDPVVHMGVVWRRDDAVPVLDSFLGTVRKAAESLNGGRSEVQAPN
jgi:DNA-binding transcriptional LysR family regulator